MRRRFAAASAWAITLALGGCYSGAGGHVDGGADGDDDAGSGSGSEGADGDDSGAAACLGDPSDPGPMLLRRLTHREYAATVRDLLGLDASALVASFPADVTTGRFDNDALNQTISVLLGERYLAAAQQLGAQVLADATLRDAVIGCDPADGEPCLRAFVERFGRRAFRRPLEPGEIDELVALALAQDQPDARASIVIETVLLSPRFVFRVELGTVDPDHPERAQLGGYEIATRLSYFLWGTMPDDALLDAAAAGTLDQADGVVATAQAMIEDPRARASMAIFGEQWLHADTIAGQSRDAEGFPEWGESLADAMLAELELRLDDAMWGEGADFLSLYTSSRGYVNDELAAIYGVDAPGGTALVPIDLAAIPDRGGLLTTAAFATASSRASDTSPVQRAMWIRTVALCDPPPPPPPSVPSLDPEDGESVQDAFERHLGKGEECAGCHLQLDPIGFGLERYDSIGRLRSDYPSGDPVRLEGTITIDGEEHSFAGGVELGALVAASAQAEACVVTHGWRWAMGRGDDVADVCGRDQAQQEFADSGRSFGELLLAVVRSDGFRYRRISSPSG
jgi:Protein of unknown function (DUF1592)/Protein of unknown function (DUF1588)/Protein of unknown function (DUF1587)/Protein of unknown function (DUF1595)/Protein of unknown function (DUF1585)